MSVAANGSDTGNGGSGVDGGYSAAGGNGGKGGCRVIWGAGRSYPSNSADV